MTPNEENNFGTFINTLKINNAYFYTIYSSISKQKPIINQVISLQNINKIVINEVSNSEDMEIFSEPSDLQGSIITESSLTFAPFFMMDPLNESVPATGLLTDLLVICNLTEFFNKKYFNFVLAEIQTSDFCFLFRMFNVPF